MTTSRRLRLISAGLLALGSATGRPVIFVTDEPASGRGPKPWKNGNEQREIQRANRRR